jgi:hypothetical protein
MRSKDNYQTINPHTKNKDRHYPVKKEEHQLKDTINWNTFVRTISSDKQRQKGCKCTTANFLYSRS